MTLTISGLTLAWIITGLVIAFVVFWPPPKRRGDYDFFGAFVEMFRGAFVEMFRLVGGIFVILTTWLVYFIIKAYSH